MPEVLSITIRTGARLHFGPLSYLPAQGRNFGGIGMMIERPGVELTASAPPVGSPFGIDSPRAQAMLESLRARLPQLDFPSRIDLAAEIPAHGGLGSGTQLALAMLEALFALKSEKYPVPKLAQLAARGDRSAVGLHGYEQGGFLIDAGHADGDAIGELACRTEFPVSWRVLLLQPNDAKGLHGSLEMQAFRQLGTMPERTSGRLCRLTLTEILPALQTGRFQEFSSALYEYGQLVGEFFQSTQGGCFSSPLMRELQRLFPEVATTGMAQSSWGPTIAMFAPGEQEANDLRRRIWSLIPAAKCRVEITHGRNRGRDLVRRTAAQ